MMKSFTWEVLRERLNVVCAWIVERRKCSTRRAALSFKLEWRGPGPAGPVI